MTRVRTLLALGTALAAAATIGGVVLGPVAASGVTKTYFATFAIATFTPATETTHNNMGTSICAGGYQASQPVSENHGDLNAVKGSFLERVGITNGATVTRLSLLANDNDTDENVHVYLVRKLLMDGLSPQFGGYLVMGSTRSSGATLNTMRRFSDTKIVGAKVDNIKYEYFLEVVNCATVEPFAAQITYTA